MCCGGDNPSCSTALDAISIWYVRSLLALTFLIIGTWAPWFTAHMVLLCLPMPYTKQRCQEKKNRKIRCCKFYTNIHFCTRIPISVRTLLFIYGWTIHLIPPCSVRGGCRHFSVVSSHRLLLYIIRLRRCLCREDAMDHTAGPPSLWADSASDCRYLLLPSSLPM